MRVVLFEVRDAGAGAVAKSMMPPPVGLQQSSTSQLGAKIRGMQVGPPTAAPAPSDATATASAKKPAASATATVDSDSETDDEEEVDTRTD